MGKSDRRQGRPQESKRFELLLRNPKAHEELDVKLRALLRLLDSPRSYKTCADECRKLIESVTGQQPDTYYLIRPTWEDDWKRSGKLYSAWFYGHCKVEIDVEGQKEPRLIEEGQEQNRALFAVFEKMVPFVLQATTARRREKFRNQLCEALENYWDLRKLLPPCYLELGDEGEKALFFGEPLDPALGGVRYRALAALIAAYPSGRRLSGDELDAAANGKDVRTTLRDLCEESPRWKEIIDFPEKKGHGYALKQLSSPPPASPQSPATPPP